MFRPDSNRDRTDYSGILMPPDGYRLDRAVACPGRDGSGDRLLSVRDTHRCGVGFV